MNNSCHSDYRNQLQDNKEHLLGTRVERSNGPTRFERSPLATPVKPNTRAYGIGINVQQAKQSDAPAAALKVWNHQMNAYQIEQKRYLHVCQSSFLHNFWYEFLIRYMPRRTLLNTQWSNGNRVCLYPFGTISDRMRR